VTPPPVSLREAFQQDRSVIAAELRPPRVALDAAAGMDAWIDTYHAVRRLARDDTFVFLTDSAVGQQEEDSLRHLRANLGPRAPSRRVVPFLTCKHTLEHCLGYADRAREAGFEALVVLGGDRHVGTPRCVEHSWQLRTQIHARQPDLWLGGWANPGRDAAAQVEFLLAPNATADFYLTQIVSHHEPASVARFLEETRRRELSRPGLFGVFYYRSANPRTLGALAQFLDVPAEALTREFEAGATAEEVCARTIRALLGFGARHFYVSNLPVSRAAQTLSAIMERVAV
jgi:5,10-methylenetetrahydrofolate reductase